MKIYKLPQLADLNANGQYLLGREDLKTEGVYLLYGRLRPKEADRKVAAVPGFEEIIYVIKGRVKVRQGKASFVVNAGEAFHPDEPVSLENMNDFEAVYIAAGGGRGAEAGVGGEGSVKEPGKEMPALRGPSDPETAEETEFEITKEDDNGDDAKEGG